MVGSTERLQWLPVRSVQLITTVKTVQEFVLSVHLELLQMNNKQNVVSSLF